MSVLPVVIDPFSRLGDEIDGATADEIALNLAEVVKSHRRLHGIRGIQYRPFPNLRQAFKGCELSETAKAALREVDAFFRSKRC